MAVLKDSGDRRVMETGAQRDMAEGKGRMDLVPLNVMVEIKRRIFHKPLLEELDRYDVLQMIESYQLSGDTNFLYQAAQLFIREAFPNNTDAWLALGKHFEDGARKYSENNWRKGMETKIYVDSAVRHFIKWDGGWTDEPHDRAVLWNIVCAIWTNENLGELNSYRDSQ